MKKLHLVTVVLLSVFLLPACDQALTDAESESVVSHGPSSALNAEVITLESERPDRYDAQLAYLSEEVPGFAGLYFDGEELVLLNAQEANSGLTAEALRTRLSTLAPDAKRPIVAELQRLMREHRVRTHTVQYDYATLHAWKQYVFGTFEVPRSLNHFGINDKLNQIIFNLHDPNDSSLVIQQMEGLGVPKQAYGFHISPEASRSVSLRSSISPTVGGVEIREGNNVITPCTMGFNLEAEFPAGIWNRSFLTADHCTRLMGENLNDPTYTGVKGSPFRQPNGGRLIGDEYYNSYKVAGPSFCNNGDSRTDNDCYNADVALVKYRSGEQYHRGKIAKINTPGSVEWTTSNFYKVTAVHTSLPIQGTAVRKIGRTTGETYGTVDNTCADFADSSGWTLCAFTVRRPTGATWPISDGGDSGSPVFRVTSGTNVTAYGVLFAGNGSDIFYATPMMEALYTQGMPDYSYNLTYQSTPQ